MLITITMFHVNQLMHYLQLDIPCRQHSVIRQSLIWAIIYWRLRRTTGAEQRHLRNRPHVHSPPSSPSIALGFGKPVPLPTLYALMRPLCAQVGGGTVLQRATRRTNAPQVGRILRAMRTATDACFIATTEHDRDDCDPARLRYQVSGQPFRAFQRTTRHTVSRHVSREVVPFFSSIGVLKSRYGLARCHKTSQSNTGLRPTTLPDSTPVGILQPGSAPQR